jgi:hypothetical protein
LIKNILFLTRNGVFLIKNNPFLTRNKVFLIKNTLFLIKNKPFLIRNTLFLTRNIPFLIKNNPFLSTRGAAAGEYTGKRTLAPAEGLWYYGIQAGCVVSPFPEAGRRTPERIKRRTMYRLCVGMYLLVVSLGAFAQPSGGVRVIGRVPPASAPGTYHIQVGSFKQMHNAQRVFDTLQRASFNPVFERYGDLIRVKAGGIRAGEVPACLERLRALGFRELWIREEGGAAPPPVSSGSPPVSPRPPAILIPALPAAAAVPPADSTERGFRILTVGETIPGAVPGGTMAAGGWTGGDSPVFAVDSGGAVRGLRTGSGFIRINDHDYVSIVVVPPDALYTVPDGETALLGPGHRAANNATRSLGEYRADPTLRLAYRFNNKGENRGSSGENGGIDIIARGKDYEWLWTTYYQGGWFYDLNGVKRDMVNGCQRDEKNGVELTVKPAFVYVQGVPYLQLTHLLRNTGNTALTGQRFGASADVMVHENDYAPLLHKPYGAYMADSEINPALELMFIGESGPGITPVDTLWLGLWSAGDHLEHIYDNSREDAAAADTALGFSYQNISLAPGETREFTVRFTLVRKEEPAPSP